MDDLDLVCREICMLQNAPLRGIRNRHHLRTTLQGQIQPNLLHHPPAPPRVIVQETIVVNGQHHLSAPQKHRRKIDVARDVDNVGLELSGLQGNLQPVNESLTEPTGLAPLDLPLRVLEMGVQFAEGVLDAEIAELSLFAEVPNDLGHVSNLLQ